MVIILFDTTITTHIKPPYDYFYKTSTTTIKYDKQWKWYPLSVCQLQWNKLKDKHERGLYVLQAFSFQNLLYLWKMSLLLRTFAFFPSKSEVLFSVFVCCWWARLKLKQILSFSMRSTICIQTKHNNSEDRRF